MGYILYAKYISCLFINKILVVHIYDTDCDIFIYSVIHSIHMSVLSVRLDNDLDSKLQFVMNKLKLQDKSAIVRQLLDKSLQSKIIDILCDEVKEHNLSAWKAAEIANISLLKMLDELNKRNIDIYDQNAFDEDFMLMRHQYAENH